jgi:hypothetical protein
VLKITVEEATSVVGKKSAVVVEEEESVVDVMTWVVKDMQVARFME